MKCPMLKKFETSRFFKTSAVLMIAGQVAAVSSGALAASNYQAGIDRIIESSSLEEVLGSKQVISSSWYPVSIFRDNAKRARNEALNNIKAFVGAGETAPLEQVLIPERTEVCTDYTQVTTREQNGRVTSSTSSDTHFELTLASVAAAFGLVGAAAVIGPAAGGLGALATLAGGAGLYNNFDLNHSRHDSHEEVGYFLVKEGMECSSTKTYIRYKAELTRDLIRSNQQILANLIQENRVKARQELLSSLAILTETTQELIRDPIRLEKANGQDAVGIGELRSFLAGWPYADLQTEEVYLAVPRVQNVLAQFSSDYQKAMDRLKNSISRYRVIFAGDSVSVAEVNRRFARLLSILNALEGKTLVVALQREEVVLLSSTDIEILTDGESFSSGFAPQQNSSRVAQYLKDLTPVATPYQEMVAQFEECIQTVGGMNYDSYKAPILQRCVETYPAVKGAACKKAAAFLDYDSYRSPILQTCASRG